MSLFQFKVSSLSKPKSALTNNLEGKSLPPTSSSAFGGFSKKAEELDNEASQFFIDENDLWNDDDKDVFEPVKNNKQKKNKTTSDSSGKILKNNKPKFKSPEKPSIFEKNKLGFDSPEKSDIFENTTGFDSPEKSTTFGKNKQIFDSPENIFEKKNKQTNSPERVNKFDETFKKTIEESDEYSEEKISEIDCLVEENFSEEEFQNKTTTKRLPLEDKKNEEVDFDVFSQQPSPKNEVCFDLVGDSDDDIILPNSPKTESPKSPTFHLSAKFNKKTSNNLKKSESGSDNYSDIVSKSNLDKNQEKNNSFSFSKEQINPLGIGKETDLWLNNILQNKAFSNIGSDTSEEKLQNNLTFLNKSYVEILEKVSSAFENLPTEFLKQFPEFDPNVFITLRTTRRRIKAIIIKTENLLKRKNSVENTNSKENKNTDFSELDSSATRVKYSIDVEPFDEISINKPSEGVFSFRQISSPQENKLHLAVKQSKLNFPLLNSPKSDVDSFTSSTPLNHCTRGNQLDSSVKPNPLNSSLIDYTDMLYKTPPKSSQAKTGVLGNRFQANMRNDGASGEFDGMNYPHSKELLEKFRQKFGLRTFRTNQLQVINAALLGFDCFVLMPTGGGKSLCYQLPALVSKGVTVVVSPLRSLILDQVTKLLTLDIAAAHLSGDLKESEASSVYMKLNQPEPKLKLLYVTPEKVGASNSLRNCLFGLYKRNMLARFVIDEAHCVSQWGHDFRPDYKKLRELRENFPSVNIMALTATATPRVRTDILHQLKVSNPKWFLSSFNRSNLVYSVREKKGKSTLKEIATLIQNDFKKDTGVVYCFSRKECEDVAKGLTEHGITAIPYHAGLNDNERTRAQNLWMNDKVKVVCATIAFGMGIDKLDVRFVIHYSLPKSIEGYYQESGRAGRDGEKATCILYYCYKDRIRMLKLINMDQTVTNQAARKVHIDNLFRVAAFAENKTDCRRALQLEYFGEKFDRKKCIEDRNTACDNCLNQGIYETIDVTNESKAIVASVKEVCGTEDKRKSNFTMLHFVDVFKGTTLKKLISEGHDTLPLYGMGKSWQRLDVERLFRKLIMEEFIKERLMVKDDGITFAYIKFGPRGEELLKGNIKIMFEVKKRKGSSLAQATVKSEERVDPSVLEIQEKCYSDLMDAIHEIASSVNCNPNAIMNVQALRAMSNNLPETAEEMLSINHVTTANFEKYGNILLEITKKYAEQKKMLQITEVPEDLFTDDPWSKKSTDDSPYFDTDITFIGKGKGGKKRKRSTNTRKPQNSKRWKGNNNSNKESSSKYAGSKNNYKSGGNGSGVKTVSGAKFALMELPTNKSRFPKPKVILKNL